MNCFGVRCIIESLTESFNKKENLYEERITVWRAENIDEAIDKAVVEVEEYCKKRGGLNFTGLSQGYWMFSEIPEDGIEVFSLLRESDLEPEEYLRTFFSNGDERQKTADSGGKRDK